MEPEDLEDRLRRHEAMIEALAKVWTRQGEMHEEQREINARLTTAIERLEGSMEHSRAQVDRYMARLDGYLDRLEGYMQRQEGVNAAVSSTLARIEALLARVVLRELERLLAESPEADVGLEWRGALRREAQTP